MARRRAQPGRRGTRSRRKKRSRYREQAKCRFCRDKVDDVDYKDLGTLSKLTTQQGKILSRKRSGNCARHQRSSKRAIKYARFLGLMPYVG